MTKLTTIEGGLSKATSHIYEVHDSEGDIVDVLRFESEKDAAEFQSGLVGDFTVKPHTLPLRELIDEVLDLRILDDEIKDSMPVRNSGLRIADEVHDLIEKIKELPEFKARMAIIDAVLSGSSVSIFSIDVTTRQIIPSDDTSFTFIAHEISLHECLSGSKVGGKFRYSEETGFSYRGKDIDASEVLHKMKKSMQKFAGVPVNGVFPE